MVLDLTQWPEDWGKDPATHAELQLYIDERPECYCCGHSGGYLDMSPLALKKTEYGTMDLFHYDCYVINLIRYPKGDS